MFSTNSSVNLKVVGTEGHSPESLRDAVSRGAKFVIYSYNFSLVVMSFKRPSNIYFIRPGENRVVKGLPFTLISLVFGWWGIPWGIIYTFQSLHQNLTGGKDVTTDMLAALAPPPTVAEDAATPAGATPPRVAPRPAPPPISGKRILTGLAVLLVGAAIVYPTVCFFQGQNLTVVLVSGLPAPYDVTVNGARHHLRRGAPEILKLPEGEFVVSAEFPGGAKEEQRATLATDFFSRPFSPRVAVLNADRAAVVYEETTFYHPHGSSAASEEPRYVLHAGQTSYLLPEPDFVFTEFPATLQTDSNASSVAKTRLAAIDKLDAEETVNLVKEKLGDAAAKSFIENYARFQPDDESLLRAVSDNLSPAEGLKLYQTRLAQRPVLVEWHRYYQQFVQYTAPQVDLLAQYRAFVKAEPVNGALLYLLARLESDPAISHPLYEQALACTPPCYYAANALGFDEISAGRFEPGLALLAQAEAHGLKSAAMRRTKRAALLGLRRYEPLLKDAHARTQAEPDDMTAVADEISLSIGAGLDLAVVAKLQSAYLQRLDGQKAAASARATAEHYLAAAIAHSRGDAAEYVKHLAQMPAKQANWALEISRGNIAAAEKALANYPQVSAQAWLLTYLAADRAGDRAAAERCFTKGTAAMARESPVHKSIAASLDGTKPLTADAICALPMYPEEKRVVLAALGVHEPASRATYFRTARLLNLEPDFPRLFLAGILKE